MMDRYRHGCWLAVFSAMAATVGASASATAGEIRIWPTAVATDDAIRLADVADLRGFDLPTQERLGRLVVHAATRPGREVLVRVADIRGALVEDDADLASIRLFGSARCRVSRPRTPRKSPSTVKRAPRHRARVAPVNRPETTRAGPRSGSLESILRDYIAARVSDPDAKLEIRFSPAAERILRLGTEAHRFKIHPANDRRLGFLSYEVDILRDGRPVQVEPIVAEVQLVKEVVIARRPINQGRTIDGRDVQFEERRFTDLASIGITDLAAVVGQQSGRFVRKGEMLRAQWLQAEALVRRGQTVAIWVRRGGVSISTTGKAQQAGRLGETITVKRDGARRTQDLIQAVVTGPRTVTVTDLTQLARR